jgi:hypothetical protein
MASKNFLTTLKKKPIALAAIGTTVAVSLGALYLLLSAEGQLEPKTTELSSEKPAAEVGTSTATINALPPKERLPGSDPASTKPAENKDDTKLNGIEGIGKSVKLQAEKLKSRIDCDRKNSIPEFREFCEESQDCVGYVESLSVGFTEFGIDKLVLNLTSGIAKVSGLTGKTVQTLTDKTKKKAEPALAPALAIVEKGKANLAAANSNIAKAEDYAMKAEKNVNLALLKVNQLNLDGMKTATDSVDEMKSNLKSGADEYKATKAVYKDTKEWLAKNFNELKNDVSLKIAEVLKQGEKTIDAKSVAFASAGIANLNKNWRSDKKFWIAKNILASTPIQQLNNITTEIKAVSSKGGKCSEAQYRSAIENLIFSSSMLTAMRISINDKPEAKNLADIERKTKFTSQFDESCKPVTSAAFSLFKFMEDYDGHAFDNSDIRRSCTQAYNAGLNAMKVSADAIDQCLASMDPETAKRLSVTNTKALVENASKKK